MLRRKFSSKVQSSTLSSREGKLGLQPQCAVHQSHATSQQHSSDRRAEQQLLSKDSKRRSPAHDCSSPVLPAGVRPKWFIYCMNESHPVSVGSVCITSSQRFVDQKLRCEHTNYCLIRFSCSAALYLISQSHCSDSVHSGMSLETNPQWWHYHATMSNSKKKRGQMLTEKKAYLNINEHKTDRWLDKAAHLDAVGSICVGKLQMACGVNQVCQSLLLPRSVSQGQMLAQATKKQHSGASSCCFEATPVIVAAANNLLPLIYSIFLPDAGTTWGENRWTEMWRRKPRAALQMGFLDSSSQLAAIYNQHITLSCHCMRHGREKHWKHKSTFWIREIRFEAEAEVLHTMDKIRCSKIKINWNQQSNTRMYLSLINPLLCIFDAYLKYIVNNVSSRDPEVKNKQVLLMDGWMICNISKLSPLANLNQVLSDKFIRKRFSIILEWTILQPDDW